MEVPDSSNLYTERELDNPFQALLEMELRDDLSRVRGHLGNLSYFGTVNPHNRTYHKTQCQHGERRVLLQQAAFTWLGESDHIIVNDDVEREDSPTVTVIREFVVPRNMSYIASKTTKLEHNAGRNSTSTTDAGPMLHEAGEHVDIQRGKFYDFAPRYKPAKQKAGNIILQRQTAHALERVVSSLSVVSVELHHDIVDPWMRA